MLPISWSEMQCPQTMLKESRKVAKVQPEFINYVDQKEIDNILKNENEKETMQS